ncbi:uncharacterized protein LOC132725166 [Ruditapes philippinarum]|uniref:uncharacterized protein LOC132725166 n=1 Tax=Ruditapes philippinarum TaxID=129788 RepID=UPI00295BF60A|nr:uncharacterized protein LOC132725166 [Ruditapes philippinarum]
MSPTNMATTDVGDELELTCTANIGSFSATIIRWHRTSETSPSDEFIDYQQPQDENPFIAGTGVSTAALVGAVVSALVVGILLGVVLTKFYQRFKRTGDRTNYQPQQIEFQETEISDVALPANTYEQLQNRTNTEGRMTYDSLNVSSSESPISPIEYEDMDHGSKIPHTYADVN